MEDSPRSATRPFETRFAEWVVVYRWQIIAATAILVLFATAGGLFLKFSTDYRIFFSEDNPELQALESLENTYGKSDNVLFIIVPGDGDDTSERALEASVWLTEQAWQTPHSTRVDSIANFQHTTADGDDLDVRDLVDSAVLGDADERARIRAVALADPRLAGGLIARDGGVSAVNVAVEMAAEDQTARVPEIAEFARDLAAKVEERFPGIDVRLVGPVMVNQVFTEASVSSQMIFLPVSMAIMALVFAALTRRFSGVMVTGFVICSSLAAAMGLGGWAGLPLSAPTAPAPTIVLMIVVANCVHLMVTLLQRMQAGNSKDAAIIESVRVNLYPVLLASATTALGFLAMNFSEVPPHRHLGTFVAFGIIASFLLSVTFLPALLSVMPMPAPNAEEGRAQPRPADGGDRGVRVCAGDGSCCSVLPLSCSGCWQPFRATT